MIKRQYLDIPDAEKSLKSWEIINLRFLLLIACSLFVVSCGRRLMMDSKQPGNGAKPASILADECAIRAAARILQRTPEDYVERVRWEISVVGGCSLSSYSVSIGSKEVLSIPASPTGAVSQGTLERLYPAGDRSERFYVQGKKADGSPQEAFVITSQVFRAVTLKAAPSNMSEILGSIGVTPTGNNQGLSPAELAILISLLNASTATATPPPPILNPGLTASLRYIESYSESFRLGGTTNFMAWTVRKTGTFNNAEIPGGNAVTNFKLTKDEGRNEWFILTFEGQIKLEAAGSYQFETRSDDGSLLFVNNQKVVDNDGDHAPRSIAGSSVNFTAGVYPLVVHVFNRRSGFELKLRWKVPDSTTFVTIPNSVFFLKN